ncbi:hypothetical protein O181_018305 [Austropuccinia psidii MF-1]|uniref:Uncharacterized protein n=1 Tax=Austropuccinia psidii MF-1 TaxID=1389203 RepID=A0A9Q3C9L7_9BASI|nr:hypothetical protein [Austropuccinia psidii MF-1]
MPIQHSPPERQTISQARTQAVLTQTPRAPLEGPIRKRTHFRRSSTIQEGGKRAKKIKFIFRSSWREEENSVEEEESDGTECVPAPVGEFQGAGGPTLAQSNQPVPTVLAIMHQMTQIMTNLQEASSSEAERQSAFKNPSMKAPECFGGTQPFQVRGFIQSCQLIFHNDPANFSQDRKKVLYSTSFLIGRA